MCNLSKDRRCECILSSQAFDEIDNTAFDEIDNTVDMRPEYMNVLTPLRRPR